MLSMTQQAWSHTNIQNWWICTLKYFYLCRNRNHVVKKKFSFAVFLPKEIKQSSVAHELRDDIEGLLVRADGVHGHQVRVENFFMISASWRKASGDIVFGFNVLTATSTRPCHVPKINEDFSVVRLEFLKIKITPLLHICKIISDNFIIENWLK